MTDNTQPSSDLESVRRLVEELEHTKREPFSRKSQTVYLVESVVNKSVPALKFLLDEYEYCNSESVQAQIQELNEGWAASLAEVERLRDENAKLKSAITKAAEEGLSHEE